MSNYNKLYTPEDSAVVFIDHQPQMTFGVANTDRATLINNGDGRGLVGSDLNFQHLHLNPVDRCEYYT